MRTGSVKSKFYKQPPSKLVVAGLAFTIISYIALNCIQYYGASGAAAMKNAGIAVAALSGVGLLGMGATLSSKKVRKDWKFVVLGMSLIFAGYGAVGGLSIGGIIQRKAILNIALYSLLGAAFPVISAGGCLDMRSRL